MSQRAIVLSGYLDTSERIIVKAAEAMLESATRFAALASDPFCNPDALARWQRKHADDTRKLAEAITDRAELQRQYRAESAIAS
jgi:hypothetical protein